VQIVDVQIVQDLNNNIMRINPPAFLKRWFSSLDILEDSLYGCR
jgi:hypothetical protein